MTTFKSLGWTPAAIGCYWTRGEFSASTIRCADTSGYVLYNTSDSGTKQIAEFIEWAEVESLSDRRQNNRRKEV